MRIAIGRIVPVTRQNGAFRANSSQVARSGKSLKRLDLRGKSKISERRISVWQTVVRANSKQSNIPFRIDAPRSFRRASINAAESSLAQRTDQCKGIVVRARQD